MRTKILLAELRLARLVEAAETRRDGDAPKRSISVAEREWPVIEEIHRLAQAWDAPLILSWANAPGPSYTWLRDKAAAAGIAFADWEPRVASVQREMPDLPFSNPHSGGHWRSWVNGEIAQSFAEAIRIHESRVAGSSPHP